MTLAEKQRQLIEDYLLIEDRLERFSALVERPRSLAPLREEEKIEANRVPGCVSQVWLVGDCENGACHFRVDADSTIVRGMAAVLCELYDGATPAEVVATEPEFVEALRIGDQLSPTRRRGLSHIRARIREIASRSLP